MRHLAQYAGDDPAEWRGAGADRISEDPAEPGAAGRTAQGDGDFAACAVAREGHALRGTRTWRAKMERRRTDRSHAGTSDPDQPSDRRDPERGTAVPAVGTGARSARPSGWLRRERGWRGGHADKMKVQARRTFIARD